MVAKLRDLIVGPQTTKIFADVTAGSSINFNGDLSTEAATASPFGKIFTINAKNGNLTIKKFHHP